TPTHLRNRISALGSDLQAQTGAELRYETIGTAPFRQLVIQWTNYRKYSASGDSFNFQIRLYETTNEIRIVYGSFTSNATDAAPQVGLGGVTNTDFNNRTTTTNWSASTAGTTNTATMTLTNTVFPSSGLTYIWTIPAPCSGTPPTLTASVSPTTACLGSPLSLSVPTVVALNITYQWQYGSGSSWTNITGATTASATVPMIPAYIGQQFRCLVTCTSSGITAPSNPSVAVTLAAPPTYAALPVSESFEGTWQSVCATRDVPNNSWRNTPVTGDASWRRDNDAAGGGWTSPTSGGYTPVSALGNYSARFHSSGAASGQTGDLDLYVNLNTPGIKQISFQYINTNGTDVLQVFLSTDGGATFSPLGSPIGVAAAWTGYSYTTNAVSATAVIRFRATSDFGGTDIGLDAVVVQPLTLLVEGLGSNPVPSGSGPSLLNGTNYGSIPVGGQIDRDFVLRNIGTSNITLFSVTTSNGTNFPIITFPSLVIPAGGTSTLRIRFTAGAAGTYNSNIQIVSSGVPNPYTFQVSGAAGNFVGNYAFSQCSGTYTPITGGTQLATGTFDDSFYTQTIPAFTFNGTSYTSVFVGTNGWLQFGGSGSTTNYSPISSTVTANGIIAPLGRDLQGNSNGEIRYQQVGDELVFQWANVKRYGGAYNGENISFQVRLNTTNGQIRVIYGAYTPPTTAPTSPVHPQVGLRGATNTDFNNRTTTTNWAASTAGTANTDVMVLLSGVAPASGLTYTWTPAALWVFGGTPLTLIAHNDLTPSTVDGTDMGITTPSVAVSRTFTLQNNQSAPISISSITSSNPLFTISAAPSSIGTCASNTATFIVNFSHTAVGTYTSDITINNNTAIGAYTFRVQAVVAIPDINVQGNSVNIPTGSTTPSLANHTDFGNVNATIAPGYFERVFTIQNTASSGNLTIGTVTISNPRFTVVVPPASVVAPGGSTTMTIRFTPIASGVQNATVTIPNNDPDESPYTFAIRATGVQPDMEVVGTNNTNVPNGKFLATNYDGTFMGVATSSSPVTATFTIRNNGNLALNISSITMAGGSPFAIANAPTSVAPGSSATFNVVYSPTNDAAQDTVKIASNFPNAPMYRFLVAAGGVISALDLQDGELTISPNPSTDVFNVQIKGNRYKAVKLSVYDVTGRKIQTITENNFTGSVPVDMRNFGAGTYLLLIETNGERVARKLVKQ
ncbi:MAG: choice-of-anchor D domain-containing protein, partial [Raineya sp.]|nr:choice-of-anchor D domain-containing protein [Raineya sp.]